MRTDIQCLRGIAIISVIFYHLFPAIFVNGFLGVDIFFVLSGYLMCRNLDKNKVYSLHDFLHFYYRRFKRILPLYYFVILLTVVAYRRLLAKVWLTTNRRYAIASLCLVTNQLTIHDQGDYFREVMTGTTSNNVFLHLWSLGLEMQFYLLVPMIFFLLEKFFKTDSLKLLSCVVAVIIGFICFSTFDLQFSFNFMPLRLWQFFAGFCAHYISNMDLTQVHIHLKVQNIFEKDDITKSSLVIIGLCLLPSQLDVNISRPLITFVTAFLLTEESNVFSSKFLCYIGDISYVLYLVHWPVIMFVGGGATIKSAISCVVITFMISIALHHLYEKVYLKFDYKLIIGLVAGLILANIFLQYSIVNHSFWNQKYSDEINELIAKNEKMLPFSWVSEPSKDQCTNSTLSESELKDVYLMKYCVHKLGNGTTSVMFIGNSVVMNIVDPIRNHFKYNYSTFEYLAVANSFGLYYSNPTSIPALKLSKKLVADKKPDVLFITARHFSELKTPFLNPKTDAMMNQMNENIAYYEKYVKRIYILGAHPMYSYNVLSQFIHNYIRSPEDIETMHLVKKEADKEMQYEKRRFSNIKCKKCKIFELSQPFIEDDKYLTFDKESMLSYVDNSIHLSTAGLRVVDHVFANITKTIMNES